MPTILELFSENKDAIYTNGSSKPNISFPPSPNQFVVIKPDTKNDSQFSGRQFLQQITALRLPTGTGVFTSNSRVKDDTRSLPVTSTARDVYRISKFLSSPKGILFISTQALLQTGNTFANTRLYNPLSTLLSTVPFVHVKRSLPPSLGLNQSTPGLLQNDTISTNVSRFEITGKLSVFSNLSGRDKVRAGLGIVGSLVGSKLKNIVSPFIIPQTYLGSRPEYKVFDTSGPVLFSPQPLTSRYLRNLSITANIKQRIESSARRGISNLVKAAARRVIPQSIRKIVPPPPSISELNPDSTLPRIFNTEVDNFKKKFYEDLRLKQSIKTSRRLRRLESSYLDDPNPGDTTDISAFGTSSPTSAKSGGSKDNFKIIGDPYNKDVVVGNDIKLQVPQIYQSLPTETATNTAEVNLAPVTITGAGDQKTDIINFRFGRVTGGATTDTVTFRAFITTIKENVKPEFNEQRYVGRTERFVTYGGVKRGLNLSFNLAAFGPDEIDNVWKRVNYLTGMAFPSGIKNGFMTPPLMYVTIGGIYRNQPCYIETLDYDFLDESTTFDIDQEVPMVIGVTMQLSLFEKQSRFQNTAFYGITENVSVREAQREAQREAAMAAEEAAERQRLQSIELPGLEAAARDVFPRFTPTPSPRITPFTPRIVEPRFSSIPSRL